MRRIRGQHSLTGSRRRTYHASTVRQVVSGGLHLVSHLAIALQHHHGISFRVMAKDLGMVVVESLFDQRDHTVEQLTQSRGSRDLLGHLGANLHLSTATLQRFADLLLQLLTLGDVADGGLQEHIIGKLYPVQRDQSLKRCAIITNVTPLKRLRFSLHGQFDLFQRRFQ